MINAQGINNEEFLEYKGRPLVRKDNDIYYGDLSDEYHVFMMIMAEAPTSKGVDVPAGTIMVQLLNSETQKPEKQQIITTGLAEAFDFADAWLTRYNK